MLVLLLMLVLTVLLILILILLLILQLCILFYTHQCCTVSITSISKEQEARSNIVADLRGTDDLFYFCECDCDGNGKRLDRFWQSGNLTVGMNRFRRPMSMIQTLTQTQTLTLTTMLMLMLVLVLVLILILKLGQFQPVMHQISNAPHHKGDIDEKL